MVCRSSLILCQNVLPAMRRRIEIAILGDGRRYEIWRNGDQTVSVKMGTGTAVWSSHAFQYTEHLIYALRQPLHRITMYRDCSHQYLIMIHLLDGRTVTWIAQCLKVSRNTVYFTRQRYATESEAGV